MCSDRMIDMGFEEIVNFILDQIPTTNLKSNDEALILQQASALASQTDSCFTSSRPERRFRQCSELLSLWAFCCVISTWGPLWQKEFHRGSLCSAVGVSPHRRSLCDVRTGRKPS